MGDYQYRFKVSIDLGKAIREVGELFDNVNDHLSKMGVHDRLGATGELTTLTVSSNRELTNEERRKMGVLIEAQFIESFPQYDVRVTELGSQPVTSSQSVS